MQDSSTVKARAVAYAMCGAILCYAATPAKAKTLEDLAGELADLRCAFEIQRTLIEDQSLLIAQQQKAMARLQQQIVSVDVLDDERAKGSPAPPASAPDRIGHADSRIGEPVGERPALAEVETKVKAVPEASGVLLPAGRLEVEPSLEFTSTTSNRLVFRGIELIPGIQIGLIEASDAQRSTLAAAATIRYGLTNRLEVEARAPFLFRSDRLEVAQQREGAIVRQLNLDEQHLGDIEFGLRYQLNRSSGQHPIFIAGLRVKSDTGKGPFDVGYDEFGVATGLATGSDFWAVQSSLNMLVPSDPAVIFVGTSYLLNISRTIDRNIGEVKVGKVDPGDVISGNFGFGFALNPRFSFSLGYRHSYVFATSTQLDDMIQRSRSLQVGALAVGMSYLVAQSRLVNIGIELGATRDAPDVNLSIRLPIGIN